MTDRTEQIMNEAIGWTIRLRDADTATWQAFTSWLEADSAHLGAYERVRLLDDELDLLSRSPAVALSAAEPARRRPWLLGGAGALAAASAAAVLLLTPDSSYTIRTDPGERRVIALDGGSQIHLNGGSVVTLDRSNPRVAKLDSGEALFSVAPDPGNPFVVDAGEATVRNLGTIFNVERAGGVIEVALAEGAVAVAAAGQAVRLSPGQMARVEGGQVETMRKEAATIGGWRTGELSYSSAALSEVAQDISRTSGITIRVEPSVAKRRFSGTIILEEDSERLRQRLGALLNVNIRVADKEWILAAPDR